MHSCSSWEPLFGTQKNTDSESNSSYTNKIKNNNSHTESYSNSNNVTYSYRRMHWLYFLLIGWWLGLCMVCMIFPLFFRGLVKKSFGYW
jgi:hypothetical protein